MDSSQCDNKLSPEALAFAPGLLSIQQASPGGSSRIVLYIIAGLFTLLLVWACVGELDIVASAQGRLIPETYIKIVQPSEGGIVQDILVHEGQEVEAGQVLLRMDAQYTQSDVRTVGHEKQLRTLELRRIDAELTQGVLKRKPEDDPILFQKVNEQLKAHRQSLQDALAQESAGLEKLKHDLSSGQEVLKKLQSLVPTYKRELEAYERLGKKSYVSEIALEEKHRVVIEKEQDLLAQQANVAALKSAIQASLERLGQIKSNYASELQNERIEAASLLNKLEEDAHKLNYKAELLNLRAPQAGTIKDLATHTRGAVVSPGTVLMTLVPLKEPLQVEVMIKNEDVGFVHEGQDVQVKLTAYPFQKYGLLPGKVVHVGADATEAGASSAEGSQTPEPSSGYKALVRLDSQHLITDGTSLSLAPGMQVVAEIHQGTRTVMEYLLSPIKKAFLEAGRER